MDRFWSKVNKSGKCWLWTGASYKDGYGKFRFRGQTWSAHRVVWVLVYGEIPEGMDVLHIVCDNPPCVNPDHLKLGTRAENNADRAGKGRNDCKAGERNPRVKLTEEQVRAIRASTDTQRAWAERLGVSPSTVQAVRSGRNWR